MSVTSVVEDAMSRKGWHDEEGAHYMRVFKVTCNSVSDGPAVVLKANDGVTRIPRYWESYPGDSLALCIKVGEAVPYEDRLHWIIPVEYGPRNNDRPERVPSSSSQLYANPLRKPPEISFGSVTIDKEVDRAYKVGDFRNNPSDPIHNSAGQPFDPSLTQPETHVLIYIVKNRGSIGTDNFSPADIYSYESTVNSGGIRIAGINLPSMYARMNRVTGTKKYYEATGDSYYEVSYEVEINPVGWQRKVLDQGFYTRDAVTGVLSKITDSDGEFIQEPVMLDGSGQKLAVGADPVRLTYNTYWATDWGNLGLPQEYR